MVKELELEKVLLKNMGLKTISETEEEGTEFLTCMNDKVFKYIIQTDPGMRVIKEIFKMLTGIKIKNFDLKNQELKVSDKNIKGKRVDFLLNDEKIVLNVEVNNGRDSNMLRNYAYINTLLINDVLKGKNYTSDKTYYLINFSRKSEFKKSKDQYEVCSIYSKKTVIEILKIIEFDMVIIKKLCYDNDVESIDKLYRYVGMFVADEELLEKLSKGDELLMEFKKEVELFNTEGRFWISPEEDEIMWENTLKYNARKAGLEEGEKRGKKIGEKKGKKIGMKTIITNMLKNGYKETDISKMTGLSLAEINDLSKLA